MKKIGTVAIGRIEFCKDQKLTTGLDLADRFSHYCILNEAGESDLEDKLPTTPKGIGEVFGKIPRSRIALETGTSFPWSECRFQPSDTRLCKTLRALGHRQIGFRHRPNAG